MVKFFLFFLQIILVSNAVPITDRRNGSGASFSYIGSYKDPESKARSFNPDHYFVSANSATWINAMADCRSVFGPSANIVTIETAGEWEFLKAFLENYSGTRYWTSAAYDSSSHVWRWTTNGQSLPYFAPWSKDNLKNPLTTDRVVIYHTNPFNASWQREVNTRMERFICEVPSGAGQILTNGLNNNNAPEVARPDTPCDQFKDERWA